MGQSLQKRPWWGFRVNDLKSHLEVSYSIRVMSLSSMRVKYRVLYVIDLLMYKYP
ncbi:hypothetical protein HanIR_Chr15g0733231 [Helianthus annuus]|nr:hypothetical protein HanIR_Chr15g0733231 [Helianthus annuus]